MKNVFVCLPLYLNRLSQKNISYTYLLFPLSVAFYIDHTENSIICINPFQDEIVNWSGIEHISKMMW